MVGELRSQDTYSHEGFPLESLLYKGNFREDELYDRRNVPNDNSLGTCCFFFLLTSSDARGKWEAAIVRKLGSWVPGIVLLCTWHIKATIIKSIIRLLNMGLKLPLPAMLPMADGRWKTPV